MNRILALALLALAQAAPDAPRAPVLTPQYRSGLTWVAPTHLRLAVPQELERARHDTTWSNEQLGITLSIDESPSTDFSVASELTEYLNVFKRKIVERREVSVAGVPGTWLVLEPMSASGTLPGASLVFARQGKLQLAIHAEAETGTRLALDELLTRVLERSVWDTSMPLDPLAPFPWVFTVPRGMRFDTGIEDGANFHAPVEVNGETRELAEFSVTHVTPRARIVDAERAVNVRAQTAEESAKRYVRDFTGEPVRESHALSVAGVSGWELVAPLRIPGAQVVPVIYVCVLATDDAEVRFLGITRTGDETTWLPRFRASVRSWKPRREATPK